MEPASANTVLIIEDERDVVDLLALNLRKAGFTTSTGVRWRCRTRKSAQGKASFDYS
jgi:DNA-binding response OmpR family regulator